MEDNFSNIFIERNFYFLLLSGVNEKDANTLSYYVESISPNDRIKNVDLNTLERSEITYSILLESGQRFNKSIKHNLPFMT